MAARQKTSLRDFNLLLASVDVERWLEIASTDQDSIANWTRRGDFEPLCALLASDKPLSAEIRILIIQILRGRIKKPSHKPPRAESGWEQLRRGHVVAKLELNGWKRTAAIVQAASELGCGTRQVQKAVRVRDAVLRKMLKEANSRRS